MGYLSHTPAESNRSLHEQFESAALGRPLAIAFIDSRSYQQTMAALPAAEIYTKYL